MLFMKYIHDIMWLINKIVLNVLNLLDYCSTNATFIYFFRMDNYYENVHAIVFLQFSSNYEAKALDLFEDLEELFRDSVWTVMSSTGTSL